MGGPRLLFYRMTFATIIASRHFNLGRVEGA